MEETPTENSYTKEIYKPVPTSLTKAWMWLLPVLIVPVVAVVGFYAVCYDHAFKIINEANFVSPDQLKNYFNTGKVVRTTLYTDERGVGDEIVRYAYIRLDESVPTGKGGHQSIKIESEPKTLELFDKQKSIKIKMNDLDFYKANLPVTFDGYGDQRERSGVPKAWKKLMAHGDHGYTLKTLPCSHKLNIAGTFWRTDDGIFVKGFEFASIGPGKSSFPAYLTVADTK